MKKIIATLIFLNMTFAFASQVGEYKYSKYLGFQQQLQYRRAVAARQARLQNANPTRNIRFPSGQDPYPNINRSYSGRISARKRFSPAYYNTNYNSNYSSYGYRR